jgi:hypothetical protein
MFDLHQPLDFYVLFIFIMKTIFIIAAFAHVYLSHFDSAFDKYDEKILYWKDRTEFIFIFTMSLLLIYYFHPLLKPKPINGETRILFFMFGWVLLITAKWSIFFHEAPWYKRFASIF